jgi:hypothetical protein
MQLKLVWLITWLGCGSIANAQTDSTAKPAKRSCSCAFSSINQVGVLKGEGWSSYFLFQTINGISYKTWFAGIGVGGDFYPVDGIPVFFDIRKNILKKKNTPFVYADAGIHFADMNKEESLWMRTEYTNGFYYDVGAGYKIGFNKRSGILLSAGYSYKAVDQKEFTSAGCGIYPCDESLSTYAWRLNRWSFKLGWQF